MKKNPFTKRNSKQDPLVRRGAKEYKSNDGLGNSIQSQFDFEVNDKTSFYQSKELLIKLIKGNETNLKPIGLKMFLHVIGNLKKNTNVIILNKKKISKMYDIPEKTIYNGINDLIKHDILAIYKSTDLSVKYWVNTSYIFNGDRLKYYKDSEDLNHKIYHI